MGMPAQPQQPQLPQVTKEETKKASQHWRGPGGLILMLDDTHIAFATDWANFVLKNFVVMCAEQAKAAKAKANAAPPDAKDAKIAPAQKSSIILTDN